MLCSCWLMDESQRRWIYGNMLKRLMGMLGDMGWNMNELSVQDGENRKKKKNTFLNSTNGERMKGGSQNMIMCIPTMESHTISYIRKREMHDSRSRFP